MRLSRSKRSFTLERDMRTLEKVRRVSTILDSDAFRGELEYIVETQAKKGAQLQRTPKSRNEEIEAEETGRIARPKLSPAPSRVFHNKRPIDNLLAVDLMRIGAQEHADRCQLACVCRLVDFFGWGSLAYSHVTIRSGNSLLTNPYGLSYAEVSASSVNRVDFEGNIVEYGSSDFGINFDAFALNSTIHACRPDAKCVIHIKTSAGMAVSCMTSGLLPTSQEVINLGRVAYHDRKGSFGDLREKRSLIADLQNSNVMILRGAGLVTLGESVEKAFSLMCSLIRACEIQVFLSGLGQSSILLPTYFPVDSQLEDVEWSALMRLLDDQGFNTGHDYSHPKSDSASFQEPASFRKGILVNRDREQQRVGEDDMWSFLESESQQEKEASSPAPTNKWDFLEESTRSATASPSWLTTQSEMSSFHPITTTVTSPKQSKRKSYNYRAKRTRTKQKPPPNINKTAEEVALSTSGALSHLSQLKNSSHIAAAQAENSINELSASASSLGGRFRTMSLTDEYPYRPPSSSGISVASSNEDLGSASFGGLFYRSAMDTGRSVDALSVSATGRLEKPMSVEFLKHTAEKVKKSTDLMTSCLTTSLLGTEEKS